jgi:hypothetical protein
MYITSMKLYTLSDVNVTPGVQEELFSNTFKFTPGGLIKDAGIELETDRVLNNCPELRDMVKVRDAEAFAFGLAYLIPPDKENASSKALLIVADLAEWMPDTDLGDSSVPVCWAGRKVLYKCDPGKTSLRHLKTNLLLRNRNGTPIMVKNSKRLRKLSEARKAFERSVYTTVYQLHS